MECPKEMAESLLSKWRDGSTVLVARLAGFGFSATMGGTVEQLDIDNGVVISALAVISPSGEVTAAPGSMVIGLRGAAFEYSDAREAPEELKEQSGALFESILT